MKSLVVFLAALLFALVVTFVASPAAMAQSSSADAEAHFKRGVSLYQEADFKAALVEFKRAYELSHNWKLLYNVGQAEYQAHDYAAALSSFETFLRDGGDKVTKARHIEVDQEIARLRARVGRMTIRANVPGAEVTIDDEPVGPATVTRNVAVGEHRVTVKRDGFVLWKQSIEVASGDDRIYEAVLEALPSAVAVAPPPPPPPPPPKTRRIPWELWTITGVLTITAVTTGILAVDAASKLDTAKGRFDVTDSELHDASVKVKTFGVATDIFGLCAVASGAVSLYFTLKTPTAEKPTAVRISPSLGGLAASGRF